MFLIATMSALSTLLLALGLFILNGIRLSVHTLFAQHRELLNALHRIDLKVQALETKDEARGERDHYRGLLK